VAVFGFCEINDCWFVFGVKDVVEIQYGVVHSPCVKCHGVDGWVSIGCVGGFVFGRCWGINSFCVGWLLGGGVCVLFGKGPI
jgi:hypothetical protein